MIQCVKTILVRTHVNRTLPESSRPPLLCIAPPRHFSYYSFMHDTSIEHSEQDVRQPGWAVPLALAALIFCVYFFISLCSTIWDRDEARFARATTEMVATGNYLYPTFNGKLRPDKPILIYWLMSVPVSLFGHTEWAYRLCPVLGTTLACLFAYSIGRSLFSHRAGLWAMLLLAANPLVAYTGAVATSDAVLLAFITGMFAVFADSLKNGLTIKHIAGLAVLFSGGMLTKGPVALLPVVSFLLTHIILRKELGSPLKAMGKIAISLLVMAAAFGSWFYLANKATNGDLYDQMFIHHVVERMQSPLENHGGYSPFYLCFYVIVIVAAFFPWTLYLPGALSDLIASPRDARQQTGRVVLLTWMGTFLVVMIAISTKLPHYILPMWPAMALCVGAFLDANEGENAKAMKTQWAVLGGLFFLLLALGLAAGIGFGPEYIGKYAKKPDALWLPYAGDSQSVRSVFGALCLIIALPLIFRHRAIHYTSNARILLGAALMCIVLGGSLLIPSFERIKISERLAREIQAHTAADAPVTVCGYSEASLIFYLKRNVSDIVPPRPADAPPVDKKTAALNAPKKVEQAVIDWASKNGPGVLVIPKTMYERYKSDPAVSSLIPIGDVNGFNYSKGQWVNVLAFRRRN